MENKLIDPNSIDNYQEHVEERTLTYDEALTLAGGHHPYQIRISILIALGMGIAGIQIMGFPFIFTAPSVECFAADTGEWFDCVASDATCQFPMRAKAGTINSIITSFDLFCGGDEYRIMAETSYMIASALGVVTFAPIADKYGKRVALILSYLITCLSLLGCSLSGNWVLFIVMLILSGLGRAPFIYFGYQLLVEVSNEFFRSMGILVMGVTFAAGAAAAGALNLAVDYDWKHFYTFFLALPSLLAFPLVYFWADESPMSYFPRSQFDKARKALQNIAKVNKKYLPPFVFETERPSHPHVFRPQKDAHEYTYLDLFRYKSLRGPAIGGAYISFVTYFVFYGQILALDALTTSPVVVAILTSVVEALSCIASVRFLSKFTRRKTIIISFMITAVAFIMYGGLPVNKLCEPGDTDCETIQKYLGYVELSLGRFWIAMLMCTTFVYANELFPTVVRARGSGLINFCGRIGSVIPSTVIYFCRHLNVSPATVFGILAAPACIAAYYMKETKGKPLAHHIEEEEKAHLDKQIEIERNERQTKYDA